MRYAIKGSILVMSLVVFGFFAPGNGAAQADPDSVKLRNDCRLAAQVLETGNPAPEEEWAWQTIDYCDSDLQLDVYLDAVEQASRSLDLPFIRQAMWRVYGFRDRTLFERVLDVAADEGATVPARVMAFVALAAMRDPHASPHYEGFIGGLGEHGIPVGYCSRRTQHTAQFFDAVTPMPSDFEERIDILADRIRLDTTQPPDVRSAAACT